jgi:twitching motility protein PilT
MSLESLIGAAREQGASDLHLEPGLPAAVRVRGGLRTLGEPIPAATLHAISRGLLGEEAWADFERRRSFDLSKTIRGVRCRINVLHTARGVGLAIRLLASFQATVEKLNLHPDLKRWVAQPHGLILLSGPTGSGKSSTLAALIQEVNLTEARHIITLESPIEYTFRPRLAYIRQREVGRDTPSFEQALIDALREDPDVLMVGEMREPETMRLTLNASETGHLVLATVHSSSCVEALQRVVSAFPAEIQGGVRAQLADCLVAVICQRLRYRPDLKIRLPECEILVSTMAVKSGIRSGEFFKLISAMESGAEHGMWTFARYQSWMETRKNWYVPTAEDAAESEPADAAGARNFPLPPLLPAKSPAVASPSLASSAAQAGSVLKPGRRIEIEPVAGGLEEIIRKLET